MGEEALIEVVEVLTVVEVEVMTEEEEAMTEEEEAMTEVIETMIVEAEVTEAMIVEAEVVALIATMTIPMIKIFVAGKEVNLNIRSQTFKDREVDHQWTMAIEAEINMIHIRAVDVMMNTVIPTEVELHQDTKNQLLK